MSLDKRSIRTESATDVQVRLTDGTDIALVSAAGNLQTEVAVALPAGTNNIGDVDVLSVVPGTGATNLGKAEDAAHSTGDTGVAIWGVRNDAAATSRSGTDGDYTPIAVDEFGKVFVTGSITAANASVDVDDAAFTPAVDSITVIGGFADETATDSVDEGDVGAIRMSLDRRMLTDSNLQVANADVSSSNPVPVYLTESTGAAAKATFDESAALAAQASETLLGDVLTASKTGTLQKVTVSSEVPFKAVIQKLDEAAAATTVATLHGEAGATVVFEPRNSTAALFTVASDGTPTARYQAVVTNNNTSGVGSSGVIHATFEWDEV